MAVGLEDLYLANLIVRRSLAPAEEVRAALEALDKSPARGDLLQRLGQRFPQLAQPDVREKAAASVQRYLVARQEAAFAARVRTTGAVPPAVLDAVVAEQKAEKLAWTLADRLVKTGKLSMVRCSLIQKEAAAELKKQEGELLQKHRSTRFRETIAQGAPALPGKRTAEYGVLDSSAEQFAIAPGPLPNAAPASGGDDMGEKTVKLPAPVAAGLVPLGAQAADGDDPSAKTVKLPAVSASQRLKAPPAPPPGPLAIGSTLAKKYDVRSELGRGGMGVVYAAFSREKKSNVALKAVSAVKATGPAADALARFKREILTATLVTSENVCEVYDAGQAEGMAYMAMELIEGETLRDLIQRDAPLPHARATALFEQIVKGVAACHSVNVIHRDLKPDNVRVTKAGVAKIVDFGIARLISKDTMINEQVFVTIKGTLSGTPAYVAPELVMEPDLVDARCDLYSLGVIFYELLTGKLPYASKATVRETLRDALEARPIPLEEAAPDNPVPEPLQRVLFKLLDKDQLVRYQSADEVLAALAAVNAPPRPPEPEKQRGITARLIKAITSIFKKS